MGFGDKRKEKKRQKEEQKQKMLAMKKQRQESDEIAKQIARDRNTEEKAPQQNKTNQIATEIDKMLDGKKEQREPFYEPIDEDNGGQEKPLENRDFIDEMITEHKDELEDSMDKLSVIQKQVTTSRRAIAVLEKIKKYRVVLEAKWIVNLLCEIENDDGIKDEEKLPAAIFKIFKHIEANLGEKVEAQG